MSAVTYTYAVYVPPEIGAGEIGLNDTVTITVHSGVPLGEPDVFGDFLREILCEFYDTPHVTLQQNPEVAS